MHLVDTGQRSPVPVVPSFKPGGQNVQSPQLRSQHYVYESIGL